MEGVFFVICGKIANMKSFNCFGFVITLIFFSCGQETKKSNENSKVDTPSINVQQVEKLAGEFVFTEGPAADKEGNVYFTDIPEQKIWIWTTDEELSLFAENTGGANGLFFDNQHQLLACEGYEGRISSYTSATEKEILAREFEGKRFNQPNDVWPDAQGGMYFTDPEYNDTPQVPQGGMHVYYLHPDKKTVTKVVNDLVKPNGIIGTPDGKQLYITDHGAGETFVYHIRKDGSLIDKRLFVNLGGDGMTLDSVGNVYLTTTGKKAVDIFSPKGELLESISFPEQPSNVSFGGKNRDQLYVTARTSLYRVALNQKGAY